MTWYYQPFQGLYNSCKRAGFNDIESGIVASSPHIGGTATLVGCIAVSTPFKESITYVSAAVGVSFFVTVCGALASYCIRQRNEEKKEEKDTIDKLL